MRRLVEGHGASALLCRDILDHGELFWRIFVNDRQRAIPTVRAERELRSGVKAVGVHTFAYEKRGDNLTTVSIEHRHHLVVATREESPVLAVDSESRGRLAWGHRPAMQYGEGARV